MHSSSVWRVYCNSHFEKMRGGHVNVGTTCHTVTPEQKIVQSAVKLFWWSGQQRPANSQGRQNTEFDMQSCCSQSQRSLSCIVCMPMYSDSPATGDSTQSHRFIVTCLIVDGQQLFFIEYHFFTRCANDFISRSKFNCITWACFFTHPTKDTFEFINFK